MDTERIFASTKNDDFHKFQNIKKTPNRVILGKLALRVTPAATLLTVYSWLHMLGPAGRNIKMYGERTVKLDCSRPSIGIERDAVLM